jgi:3-hydroxybutyryl-CoA dehydrogenase
MKIEDVKKISVVGAGIMGSQIAENLSRIGNFQVCMVDKDDLLVKKGLQSIEHRLERYFVSKGKLTEGEKRETLTRIAVGTDLQEAVGNADVVIEAVVENLDLKKEIFKKLDHFTPLSTILASNTSLQNISEMASGTNRPDKVVGMHFFNPVAMMRLVEIIKGAYTSGETISLACDLARRLGKEPVVCKDSSYGFLANRAYIAMVNEAAQMVWERVASPAEIDKALKLGMNLPEGPLRVWDVTGGWPVLMASEQDAIRELGPEKGRLNPVVRMMARAGYTKIYEFWEEVFSKW